MAVDDPLLRLVGRAGGPLADAALWPLTVQGVESITEDYRRITFGGPGLGALRHQPGQDLMLRIPADEGTTNRRYTIRRTDPIEGTVTVDMVVHGDGPGARWAGAAVPGASLEAIGPRGKVVVRAEAAWHLFVGDETALPGMAAMAESLRPGVPGTLVIELPRLAPGHAPRLGDDQHVALIWVERQDAQPGDPSYLTSAVERVALPPGRGHAYVAGEMGVVRAVTAVLAARGLDADQISPKAYWRRDTANAPHGEPLGPEQSAARAMEEGPRAP
jgi:NADPH-dependent ferric siderophore reductase